MTPRFHILLDLTHEIVRCLDLVKLQILYLLLNFGHALLVKGIQYQNILKFFNFPFHLHLHFEDETCKA